jgi:hypothetical protein
MIEFAVGFGVGVFTGPMVIKFAKSATVAGWIAAVRAKLHV